MKTAVLIAGSGPIGNTIAYLLSQISGYQIFVIDRNLSRAPQHLKKIANIQFDKVDVTQKNLLSEYIQEKEIQGVIACLPFYLNKEIASLAQQIQINYFDLTEDINTVAHIQQLAKNSKKIFVPQCGLAPGFINIIAHHLMQSFDKLQTAHLRCGGIPRIVNNELKYAFTWSIDGLLNEYQSPCPAISNGKFTYLEPLADLEQIQIDGLWYEAFNTSGGIGALTDTYRGKIDFLNYKTIRYPGHRDKMRFILEDLKLSQDINLLKKILLNAIPTTSDDVVIIYVNVIGWIKDQLENKNFVSKYYGQKIAGYQYSALQLLTAASASTVVHHIMQNSSLYHGFVRQEQFSLDDLLQGPFGQYLREKI